MAKGDAVTAQKVLQIMPLLGVTRKLRFLFGFKCSGSNGMALGACFDFNPSKFDLSKILYNDQN